MQGLTVCVNYADMLAVTLPRWAETLDGITVVTVREDADTLALCDQYRNVRAWVTDAFYRAGAAFDKGGAMSEASAVGGALCGAVWCCVFDADILPPASWRANLPILECGCLYGAHRWQQDPRFDIGFGVSHMLPDREWPGYFWVFHRRDPHLPADAQPLWTSWQHAGGYDSDFQALWPLTHRVRLNTHLLHLGEDGCHWWGRNEDGRARMREMYEERARRGGSVDHERIG